MKKTTKPLEIIDFIYLMLATLANNSKTKDVNSETIKIASIPTNYKQIIQNILCTDNRWKEEFCFLINLEEYFEDHFSWELKLSIAFEQVLLMLDKKIEFDFLHDRLLIKFTQEEIDNILRKYSNIELNNIMKRFTSLLVDYIYTREFQEEFYDYSASAVKKMKEIQEAIYHNKDCDIMGECFSNYSHEIAKEHNIPIMNAKDIITRKRKK